MGRKRGCIHGPKWFKLAAHLAVVAAVVFATTSIRGTFQLSFAAHDYRQAMAALLRGDNEEASVAAGRVLAAVPGAGFAHAIDACALVARQELEQAALAFRRTLFSRVPRITRPPCETALADAGVRIVVIEAGLYAVLVPEEPTQLQALAYELMMLGQDAREDVAVLLAASCLHSEQGYLHLAFADFRRAFHIADGSERIHREILDCVDRHQARAAPVPPAGTAST